MLRLVCLFLPIFLWAKPDLDYQKIEPLSALAQKNFSIEKNKLKYKDKSYQIFIAQSKGVVAAKKAFYILDANKHFPLLLNALSEASKPYIIVGIGYDNELGYDLEQRTRDYTPKVEGESLGGGEAEFFNFLVQKLLPTIKAKYPSVEKQALFGHSFGGLFTLNALVNHELIFDAYFIASPSLWWGNASFLPARFNPAKCPEIMIFKGTLENTRKPNELKSSQLAQNLQEQSGCEVLYSELKNKNHGSVIKPALILALNQFLKE